MRTIYRTVLHNVPEKLRSLLWYQYRHTLCLDGAFLYVKLTVRKRDGLDEVVVVVSTY